MMHCLGIVLIATVTLVRYPSWFSALVLLVALALSLLAERIGFDLVVIRTMRHLRTRYLDFLKECQLIPVDVNKYLRQSAIEVDRDEMSGLRDAIVFIVSRVKGGGYPCAMRAFALPFGPSFLFLRDMPQHANAIERFFLLHELGHATGVGSLGLARPWVIASLAVLLPIWIAIASSGDLEAVAAGFIWAILSFSGVGWRGNDVVNEATADSFAMAHLNEADRARLRQLTARRTFPRDPALSDAGHAERLRMLSNWTSTNGKKPWTEIRVVGGWLSGVIVIALFLRICWVIPPYGHSIGWRLTGLAVLLLVVKLGTGRAARAQIRRVDQQLKALIQIEREDKTNCDIQ